MTNRRVVAAICFVAFAVMGINSSVLGPTLRDLAAALSLPIADAGIFRALQQFGFFASTMIGGVLLSRYSLRVVLVPAMLIYTVGLIGTVSTNQLGLALVPLTLIGLGQGFLNLGGNVAIGALFDDKPGPMLSALHTFFGLGLFLGPLLAHQVLQAPDQWRLVYIIPSGACIILGVAFALLKMQRPERRPDANAAGAGSEAGKPVYKRPPIRWLPLLPLVILLFMYTGAGNGFSDWIATHLQLVAHISADSAAQITSLYGLFLTAGRAVGIVTLIRFSNTRVMWATMAIAILGAALIVFGGAQVALISIGVALVGFGFGPVYPTVIAIAGKQQPENRGTVTGIIAGTAALGGIVIPVLYGWVGGGHTGGMPVLLVCTLIMVAALVMLGVLQASNQARDAQQLSES